MANSQSRVLTAERSGTRAALRARREVAASAARPELPAVQSLDALIHERQRLGIIAALAVNDAMSFNELKDVLEITDGNLSDHARKLERAGYVRVEKTFRARKPLTRYQLTSRGRQALRGYMENMQSVLDAVSGA